MAQRIVRAKQTLADARVPFEVPSGGDLDERLSSVLEVIYLIFNEGYSATAGDDWMRPALCEDALRLGRILGGPRPDGAGGARARGADGDPGVAHARAHRPLWRARFCCSTRTARAGITSSSPAAWPRSSAPSSCGGALRALRPAGRDRRLPCAGPLPEETDWERIAALYEALSRLTPSPVVELNRAVAVAMAFGPAAGLELVDALASEPALEGYHLLPSVRGDLLAKLGRRDEARVEFERAAELTRNERERTLLRARAAGR